jgi:hypothetical protein
MPAIAFPPLGVTCPAQNSVASERWLNAAVLWLLGLLLCGCGERPLPPEPVIVEPAAPPEPAWEAQLLAVRAGTSSQIEVTTEVSPEQWQQLAEGCDALLVLKLPRAQLSDQQLAVLPRLVSLRQLVLGAAVGDAGLAYLAECPSLEIVNLPHGTFTDTGLQHLQRLPLLTLLRFGSPHVTDAGMESLPQMDNLRFVHLLDVPITDAGLEPLKRCRLLESFYLDGSRCTDEGLSCLLKSHPGLHLHVNQRHLSGDAPDHEH